MTVADETFKVRWKVTVYVSVARESCTFSCAYGLLAEHRGLERDETGTTTRPAGSGIPSLLWQRQELRNMDRIAPETRRPEVARGRGPD